jgi:ABC-type uncharacterized transport system permease subunit
VIIAENLLILAALGYLVASVFYGAQLFKQHVSNRALWLAIARFGGDGGLVAHTAAIGVHCATTHHTPFTTSAETLSATGWAIAGVYIATELLQWRNPPTPIGAFAFPLAFLALFAGLSLSALGGAGESASGQLDSKLISLHVTAILGAYGMLALAACCGIIYIIENGMLKRKQVASKLFTRLPPLATIDHMTFTLVSLALTLLTLGISAGEIRAYSSHRSLLDWKAVVSMVAWITFAAYLLLHSSRIAVGVRGNYLIFVGLLISLLTFFVPSPLHH